MEGSRYGVEPGRRSNLLPRAGAAAGRRSRPRGPGPGPCHQVLRNGRQMLPRKTLPGDGPSRDRAMGGPNLSETKFDFKKIPHLAAGGPRCEIQPNPSVRRVLLSPSIKTCFKRIGPGLTTCQYAVFSHLTNRQDGGKIVHSRNGAPKGKRPPGCTWPRRAPSVVEK
jgi:uncharacterized protein YjhX (UPF0386 family)